MFWFFLATLLVVVEVVVYCCFFWYQLKERKKTPVPGGASALKCLFWKPGATEIALLIPAVLFFLVFILFVIFGFLHSEEFMYKLQCIFDNTLSSFVAGSICVPIVFLLIGVLRGKFKEQAGTQPSNPSRPVSVFAGQLTTLNTVIMVIFCIMSLGTLGFGAMVYLKTPSPLEDITTLAQKAVEAWSLSDSIRPDTIANAAEASQSYLDEASEIVKRSIPAGQKETVQNDLNKTRNEIYHYADGAWTKYLENADLNTLEKYRDERLAPLDEIRRNENLDGADLAIADTYATFVVAYINDQPKSVATINRYFTKAQDAYRVLEDDEDSTLRIEAALHRVSMEYYVYVNNCEYNGRLLMDKFSLTNDMNECMKKLPMLRVDASWCNLQDVLR